MDQLLERIPYQTTKESMQFSVRSLEEKGIIEKLPVERRRGRARRLYEVTPLGLHWAANLFGPKNPAKVLADEVELELGNILNEDIEALTATIHP